MRTVDNVINGPVYADVPKPVFSPGPAGTHITIRGLTKYFAGWPLYENFDLDIPKQKIVSVFGPNGCGKSTLINMIAGLIPIDSGEILFDGKSLKDTKIGYVFQNYREAMFPWMRTIDNIAYPLKLEGRSKAEVDRRMQELVASFDVKFDLRRYPYELSGGQQQTASIMRALAPNPEVLFLDEPFSALDFEMTLFIREKLQEVFMQTGTTMLLVSHDLEEAVYLADQVLLLTKRPTKVAEILEYARCASAHARDAEFGQLRQHEEAQPRDLPARSAPIGDRAMTPAQIETYVDASSAALGLRLRADHRPGVVALLRTGGGIRGAWWRMSRSAPHDEPAVNFVPVAPTGEGRMSGRELLHKDASTMAAAVQSRAVSAVALVQASLDRIEATDRRVNAFTDVVRERALRRAAQIDASLLLGPGRTHPRTAVARRSVRGEESFRHCWTADAGRFEDRAREPAGARRCRTRPPDGKRRCGAGRCAQHGRVRLRLHDREQPFRCGAQPA